MGQVLDLDLDAECAAIEQHWRNVNQSSVVDGGAAVVHQGLNFEKVVYDFLSKKHPTAKIRQQVTCEAGRADIVVFCRNGKHIIVECKCFHKTKLSKSHVDQVIGYRECLEGTACIFISHDTELTRNVKEYAKQNDVRIRHVDK